MKDSRWLYAFWELQAADRATLRERFGDRAASLARVTLRLTEGGHQRLVIPPQGSQTHYLEVERPGERARVELGFTLPSGRFEALARSQSVTPPKALPAGEVAGATLRFPAERDRARELQAAQLAMRRRRRVPADPPPRAAGASDAFRARGASDAWSPPGGPGRQR